MMMSQIVAVSITCWRAEPEACGPDETEQKRENVNMTFKLILLILALIFYHSTAAYKLQIVNADAQKPIHKNSYLEVLRKNDQEEERVIINMNGFDHLNFSSPEHVKLRVSSGKERLQPDVDHPRTSVRERKLHDGTTARYKHKIPTMQRRIVLYAVISCLSGVIVILIVIVVLLACSQRKTKTGNVVTGMSGDGNDVSWHNPYLDEGKGDSEIMSRVPSTEIWSTVAQSPPPLRLKSQSPPGVDERSIKNPLGKSGEVAVRVEPTEIYTVIGGGPSLPLHYQTPNPEKPKRIQLPEKSYPCTGSRESIDSTISVSKASAGAKSSSYLSGYMHTTKSREGSDTESEEQFYHHFPKYYIHSKSYWASSRHSSSYLSSMCTDRPCSVPSAKGAAIVSNAYHFQDSISRYSTDELTSCTYKRGAQKSHSEWSMITNEEAVVYEKQVKLKRHRSCSPALSNSASTSIPDKTSYKHRGSRPN
ncbi:uncharacterized protein LOC102353872 [Latimeria chalumnae]|uniref:uncharacterized protein LOC102353872 n=1 Tax=Latimeria chalumnae TaxID=7897 RepID=UPI0003C1519C|nr:PREDICTED: uncharacterized protein LOC102353872 [Latimeria chalumnae]|eukprot:XP_014341278.1 PREDICTED: uncharacterized protein LOC102353872 [Latimeria chalumnae]